MTDILTSGRIPFDVATTVLPTALNMTLVKRRRPVTPHPESDFQIDFETDLNQSSLPNMFTVVGGAYSVSDGVLTPTPGGTDAIVTINTPAPLIPNFMFSCDVTYSGNGAASDQVRLGLYKDGNNYAMVVFNSFSSQMAWAVRIGGVNGSSTTYSQSLASFTKIGVSVTGNQLSGWGWNGKTWVLLTTIDLDASVKFTQDLSGWKYGFWCRTDGANPQTLSRFKITPFGGLGIRDIKFATFENGEPIVIDGDYIMTATVAAPNDIIGRGLYLGVFRFNPGSYKVSQCGRLYFSETISTTTTFFGGASGKIVMDRRTRSWTVFVSTYGSPSTVGVAFKTLSMCPLFGTNTIDGLTYISPSRNDADIYWDGTQWVLVYCKASTTPAIRKAATIADLVNATPVDLGTTTTEGVVVRKIGGVHYLMTQDYTAHEWRVWSLPDLVNIGSVGVTLVSNMYSAHPNIIPVHVPGGTKFVAVSFSNTGFTSKLSGALTYCNGDLLVWESQTVTGKEWADVSR